MFRTILFYLTTLCLLLSVTVNILTLTDPDILKDVKIVFALHVFGIAIGMSCALIARKNPATSSLLDRSRSGIGSFGGIVTLAWQTRPKWIVITGIAVFCYAMFCFFFTFFPDHLNHADPSLPPAAQQIVEDQLKWNYNLITFSSVWIYVFFFCFGYLWKFRKST